MGCVVCVVLCGCVVKFAGRKSDVLLFVSLLSLVFVLAVGASVEEGGLVDTLIRVKAAV